MLKLLERNITALDERLILLAPPQASAHSHYRNVDIDPRLHHSLLGQMQALRGQVYLQDGAISRRQLSDGRHQTPEDDRSWHLLMLDARRRVSACVWYMEHPNTIALDSLRVRSCPLAQNESSRSLFRGAIESELKRARRFKMRYAEIGGWAVAPEYRGRSEGLLLALAAYSLGRIAGGALGLTTATVRHASSAILRRIGGSHLMSGEGPVPAYYDPRYNCEMELLRFDSRRPSAKFAPLVEALKDAMAFVPVVASTELEAPFEYAAQSPAAASLFAA
jgi:hypothetical protein